jgi:hypothetical protein
MPRTCIVCRHPERDDIETDLRAGTATGIARIEFPDIPQLASRGCKEMMAILDKSHNKSDSVSAGITGGCAGRECKLKK